MISKSDLADSGALDDTERAVRTLNPWASIERANLLDAPLTNLFSGSVGDIGTPISDEIAALTLTNRSAHRHANIVSRSLVLDEPLDWTAFGVWMTMLLHRHGAQVLRVKGLLAVDGLPGPTLFQSAQHLVHPPVHMDDWPSDDRDRGSFSSCGIWMLIVLKIHCERSTMLAETQSIDHRISAGQEAVVSLRGGRFAARRRRPGSEADSKCTLMPVAKYGCSGEERVGAS